MYVPERVITNGDLAAIMDTTDEWIRSRTGIERRHIAAPHETTASMAIEAARAALRVADADPREIDLILVATMTPDMPTPSTACLVQNALGAIHAGAVDLNAGCSGFVYAVALAHQAIASGEHDLVLVIGADTMSRIVDQNDRATAVLFGDGAGAVLLGACERPSGVLATLLGSDGSGGDLLIVPAGGSAMPASAETVAQGLHYLKMEGREVFRFATRIVPRAIEEVIAKAGLTLDEIDWIIPHQANSRIIEAAAKNLQMDKAKFFVNLNEYGNTSAASVPIALCEAIEKGHIQPGQQIVLVGFGAGLTWAAAVLKWGPSVREAPTTFHRRWLRWLLYQWAAFHTRWLRLIRTHTGHLRRMIAKRWQQRRTRHNREEKGSG